MRSSHKTAGYHRHILRLPIFCKEGFQEDDNVFFLKKNTFFIIFSNFSNFQNFLIFCQKNLIIKAEKTLLRNNTIWYVFYSKFANFIDFEKNVKFFFKIPSVFAKTPNFERFENSYYSSRILRQICYNLVKK